MNNGMHIVYLYADDLREWNCSQWRALTPADAINAEHAAGRTAATARLYHLPSALDWSHIRVQQELGLGDILIFQRNVLIREVWDAMDYWRAVGKTVVVDLDDHYPGLPASNPAHAYWIVNRPELDPDPVNALAEGLRHADGLTAPSKTILEDWSHIVPGYWLPNWTRRPWYENLIQKPVGGADLEIGYEAVDGQPSLTAKRRPDSEGQIIIGWGGSISHVDSWLYSGIIGALDRLFEVDSRVRLKFCGGERRLAPWLGRWGDRVIYQPGVRPADWPQVISTFDIGIAPLDLRPLDPPWREGAPIASYDERRSWLKGAEYLSAGVPWVASRSRTYHDLARWGTMVENTPEAWYEALTSMIRRLGDEKREAWSRRSWALKHVTLEANIQAYTDVLARIALEKNSRQGEILPGITYVERQAVPA